MKKRRKQTAEEKAFIRLLVNGAIVAIGTGAKAKRNAVAVERFRVEEKDARIALGVNEFLVFAVRTLVGNEPSDFKRKAMELHVAAIDEVTKKINARIDKGERWQSPVLVTGEEAMVYRNILEAALTRFGAVRNAWVEDATNIKEASAYASGMRRKIDNLLAVGML